MSKLELPSTERAKLHHSVDNILRISNLKGIIFLCVGIGDGSTLSTVYVDCPDHTDAEVACIVNAAMYEGRKQSQLRFGSSANPQGGEK